MESVACMLINLSILGTTSFISSILPLHITPFIALGASPDGGGTSNPLITFGPLLIMVVIFYLIAIRPQQKRQKEHKKMLEELKKGDKVVTTGGMYAEIFAFNEERGSVVLRSGELKLEFLKSSIASKVSEEKA